MYAFHDSHERVAIPPGFPIGLLFGRQGSHLQEVKQRTKARIRINIEAGHIDLAGSPAAVQAAADFYHARFAEHAAAGAGAVAPSEAVLLLATELTAGARFVPTLPGGELAAAPAGCCTEGRQSWCPAQASPRLRSRLHSQTAQPPPFCVVLLQMRLLKLWTAESSCTSWCRHR